MIQTRIQNPPIPDFVPVPRRASSGGWSVKRQRDFIAALAATGSVAQAAAAVGMSKTGVYLLRNARGGEDFRHAWDAAIEAGVAVLKSVAFERAIDGIEETVCADGEPVRTTRRFDNGMLTRLLAIYDTLPRAEARADAAAAAARRPLSRVQLVDRFKTLCRRIAAEEAEAKAHAAAPAEAAAAAAAGAADARLTPHAVVLPQAVALPPFAPPMTNRPAPVQRDCYGLPIEAAAEPPGEAAPGSNSWRRPERPLPRIWTG